MRLRGSALHAAKAGSKPEDYEDSFAHSADWSLVAVSDGAGSAFESGRWAQLLTQSFTQSPPPGLSAEQLLDWADGAAALWTASIPWQELSFFELDKATEEGSAATLVGLRLAQDGEGRGTWSCLALGDSCLFQVSGDRLVRATPLSEPAQFGRRPPLFYTIRSRTERAIGQLATAQGRWTAGDRFLLLTDAMAEWFLREHKRGGKPWNVLAGLDQDSFEPFIDRQRYRKLIENDDVTAVLLELLPVAAAVLVPPPPLEPGDDQPMKPDGPPVLIGAGQAVGRHAVGESGQAPAGAQPYWEELVDRYLERLRKPSVVATVVVALLIGILIGRAIAGRPQSAPKPAASPTPAVKRTPAVNPARAMDATADKFTASLLNLGGGLGAYEHALDGSATPALAGRLPSLLGLKASRLGGLTSAGTVLFTAPGPGADTVYVGARQSLTAHGKPLAGRFLLVRLTLAGAGATWAVSDVSVQPAVSALFPTVSSGTATGGGSGGSGN
jgi:hypothetical protein